MADLTSKKEKGNVSLFSLADGTPTKGKKKAVPLLPRKKEEGG